MIRYNKRIFVKETTGGFRLETDRGDHYEVNAIKVGTTTTPITDWWEKQGQTQLRRDQLDCIVKEYWRQYTPLDLFVVYKKGQGYSQPHDIMLAYDPTKQLWILSTDKHTWFVQGQREVVFNVDDALGPISNLDSRFEIYEVIDGISNIKVTHVSID